PATSGRPLRGAHRSDARGGIALAPALDARRRVIDRARWMRGRCENSWNWSRRARSPSRTPSGVLESCPSSRSRSSRNWTASALVVGAQVERLYDVGVSGLHRLLRHAPALREADAVVVCAGMEGALPSVVGGLVARPVIAVPTSVGYGASLGGMAALLAMLNSCAANVSVVNIDNGFSAGFVAALIARQSHAARAEGEGPREARTR